MTLFASSAVVFLFLFGTPSFLTAQAGSREVCETKTKTETVKVPVRHECSRQETRWVPEERTRDVCDWKKKTVQEWRDVPATCEHYDCKGYEYWEPVTRWERRSSWRRACDWRQGWLWFGGGGCRWTEDVWWEPVQNWEKKTGVNCGWFSFGCTRREAVNVDHWYCERRTERYTENVAVTVTIDCSYTTQEDKSRSYQYQDCKKISTHKECRDQRTVDVDGKGDDKPCRRKVCRGGQLTEVEEDGADEKCALPPPGAPPPPTVPGGNSCLNSAVSDCYKCYNADPQAKYGSWVYDEALCFSKTDEIKCGRAFYCTDPRPARDEFGFSVPGQYLCAGDWVGCGTWGLSYDENGKPYCKGMVGAGCGVLTFVDTGKRQVFELRSLQKQQQGSPQEFVVAPPPEEQSAGRIVGYVYRDSDNVCPAEGKAQAGVMVTLSGGVLGESRMTYSDGSGRFEFANVPPGLNTYNVAVAPPLGWVPVCPLSGVQSSVTVGSNHTTTLNFSLSESPALTWFQAINGDVNVNGSVTSQIPSSVGEGVERHLLTGEASGILRSGGSINTGEGSISRSGRNWKMTGLPSLVWPSFDWAALERASLGVPDFKNLAPRAVYFPGGDLTLGGTYNLKGEGVAVILVKGDLRFSGNFTSDNPGQKGILFLVRGNVRVDRDVSRIDAALVVNKYALLGGVMRIETGGGKNDSRLTINGLVMVEDHFQLPRDRRDADANRVPVETFVYNPLYVISDLPVLTTTSSKWKEVRP